MNKTPKTEWKQGGDEQRMMIWKVVAYDSFYGMCLAVSRNPDEFTPSDFMYILPDDTDKNTPVTLTFQKRGHITAQIKCALTDSNAEKWYGYFQLHDDRGRAKRFQIPVSWV